MYLISSRLDFYDNLQFSDSDAIAEVPLPDPDPRIPVSEADFIEKVRGKKILVLVHGYHVDKEALTSSYGVVESKMRTSGFLTGANPPYDMVIGYTWPGGLLAVAFDIDVLRANEAGERFEKILTMLNSAAAVVDVQTHSLGARVALEALKHSAVLRNLWMLAAAVENESIQTGETYFEATENCDEVYTFDSSHDSVLGFWFRLGNVPSFDGALGFNGPENPQSIRDNSPNVKVVDCSAIVGDHSGYRDAPECYDYWLNELTGQGSEQFVVLRKGGVVARTGAG